MRRLSKHTYPEAVLAHQDEVIEALRRHSPRAVVAMLKRHGWERDWACAIVTEMELPHNPAGLKWDRKENERQRRKYGIVLVASWVVLLVGLAIMVPALWGEGADSAFKLVASGAALFGAVGCVIGLRNLQFYPERSVPVYRPPRNPAAAHVPEEF